MPEIFVETGGVVYNALESRWGDVIADHWMTRMDEATRPVGKVFSRFADNVLRPIYNQHRQPWHGRVVNSSRLLQRRSGRGIKSIMDSRHVVEGPTLDDVSASMHTGRMAIHETGGTVRARRVRYLTIPLPAALDRRGVQKKKSARDWPNTFIRRTRNGNLLILQKRGKQAIPLYLLKPNVYIPPRLRMQQVWEAGLPRLERSVIRAIEGALINASATPGVYP